MGLDPKQRVGRLVEGLALIERLWTGEPVTWKGTHFQVEDVRISMPTVQRPRPPIWLAANGDAGVRRAATIADAWLMNPHSTLATLERQLALFRRAREASGRPPAAEIPVIKECLVAATKSAALAAARPFLESKYRAYQRWEQDKALPPGESFALDFEALARIGLSSAIPRAWSTTSAPWNPGWGRRPPFSACSGRGWSRTPRSGPSGCSVSACCLAYNPPTSARRRPMTTSGVSSRRTFLKSAVASSIVITFPRPLRAQAKDLQDRRRPSGDRPAGRARAGVPAGCADGRRRDQRRRRDQVARRDEGRAVARRHDDEARRRAAPRPSA